MARLPLNWGETVSELVVGVVLSGGIDSVVVAVSCIIGGQSSRGEELFTQRGGPILPVSGGFDRVSVHEEKELLMKKLILSQYLSSVGLPYHIQQ